MSRFKASFQTSALILLAMTLVMSSCFTIRKFTLKPKSLTVFDGGQVFVDMYPKSHNTTLAGYPFVLVGLDDLVHNGTGPFDAKGKYGGPYDSILDNDVRNVALVDDSCQALGIDANDAAYTMMWKSYRSTDVVDSSWGGFKDNLRVKVKMGRELGTDDDSYGTFVIIAGMFVDDNDNGTAESGEVFCSSVIWSQYPFDYLIAIPT